MRSHFTPPLHCAWQFALALTDASHFGGTTTTLIEPPAAALNVAIALTAAVHHMSICFR